MQTTVYILYYAQIAEIALTSKLILLLETSLTGCMTDRIEEENTCFVINRGTQCQFSENICSEDDLRSRIFGTFVVKFVACLPLQGFSNI